MRRPHELSRAALIEIVDALQQSLYLDASEGQFVWTPDKDCGGADALMELAGVLAMYDLAPAVPHPFIPGEPYADGP